MWTQIRLLPQEQSDLDLHCCQMGFIDMFAYNESRRLVLIGFLRVNKCEFSVYNATIFIKYAQVCAAQTTY